MRILVLGGTRLVGRGFVEAALARGHRLTLFHRGKTYPERFPEVERILGDRDQDLAGLEGRTWDAVYDPSASQPHRVQAALAALGDRIGTYMFVSSVSVYAGPQVGDETSARAVWDGTSGAVTPENYGGYKARCEDLVAQALPGRHTILRLGLVIGPYDESARFNVYARRLALGGEVLVPGPPDAPMQLIDGRDAGEFAVGLLEQGGVGPYNLTGPTWTTAEALSQARLGAGEDGTLVWADPAWLRTQGVAPDEHWPLWTEPEDRWLWQVDSGRAVAHGLRCRPLADSTRDALAWEQTRAEPTPLRLELEREQALVKMKMDNG